MKAKITQEDQPFRPVDLTITFTDPKSLALFYALFNQSSINDALTSSGMKIEDGDHDVGQTIRRAINKTLMNECLNDAYDELEEALMAQFSK